MNVTWPDGRQFAFTIVDDTDGASVATVKPIYDFIADIGMRTTKTVWPLRPVEAAPLGGETLEDDEHAAWIRSLASKGFEIGFHGVTDHSSERARTVAGFDVWQRKLGRPPRIYASHSGQREAMYWGVQRFAGAPRSMFRAFNRYLGRDIAFYGEVEGSPYFWGDICRDTIEYCRNFTFRGINTLQRDPGMPWHDPTKPYVKYWFSSSDGSNGDAFCALLSEANQDRLRAEGGACIVYTHFAYKFVENGQLRPDFRRLMERLAKLDGWFVPASTILDHLRARAGWREDIRPLELQRLQWRWILDNVRTPRARRYARRLLRRFT